MFFAIYQKLKILVFADLQNLAAKPSYDTAYNGRYKYWSEC